MVLTGGHSSLNASDTIDNHSYLSSQAAWEAGDTSAYLSPLKAVTSDGTCKLERPVVRGYPVAVCRSRGCKENKLSDISNALRIIFSELQVSFEFDSPERYNDDVRLTTLRRASEVLITIRS